MISKKLYLLLFTALLSSSLSSPCSAALSSKDSFLNACKFGNIEQAMNNLDYSLKNVPSYYTKNHLRLLLKQLANKKDNKGNTPLHYICINLFITKNNMLLYSEQEKNEYFYYYYNETNSKYNEYLLLAALLIHNGARENAKNKKSLLPHHYFDYNSDKRFNKILLTIKNRLESIYSL